MMRRRPGTGVGSNLTTWSGATPESRLKTVTDFQVRTDARAPCSVTDGTVDTGLDAQSAALGFNT